MSAATTFTLSADEVAALAVGKATCMKLGGKHAVVYFKSPDGALKVAPNTCVHMSAALSPDVEDVARVKCGMHGAVLDASTMAYVSGPTFMAGTGGKCEAGTPQPQFAVTRNADGSATLVAPEMPKGGCAVA